VYQRFLVKESIFAQYLSYYPSFTKSVLLIAQEAALNEDLVSDNLEFNKDIKEELLEKIRKAESENNIVIIILDIWTLELEKYQSIMKKYDKERYFNSAVLVPWNEEDFEIKKKEKQLIDNLKKTFYRQSGKNLRTGITSYKNLLKEIQVVLNERRNSIIDYLQVHNNVICDHNETLPNISASK